MRLARFVVMVVLGTKISAARGTPNGPPQTLLRYLATVPAAHAFSESLNGEKISYEGKGAKAERFDSVRSVDECSLRPPELPAHCSAKEPRVPCQLPRVILGRCNTSPVQLPTPDHPVRVASAFASGALPFPPAMLQDDPEWLGSARSFRFTSSGTLIRRKLQHSAVREATLLAHRMIPIGLGCSRIQIQPMESVLLFQFLQFFFHCRREFGEQKGYLQPHTPG